MINFAFTDKRQWLVLKKSDEDEARRTRYEVGFYLRFRWSTSTADARRDLQLCQDQKQPREIPVI